MSQIPVPANLPQRAAQTTAEHPWPLRLLSAKMKEYISAMSRTWVEGEIIQFQRRPGAKVQFLTVQDLQANVRMTAKILSHLVPDSVQEGTRVVLWAKPDYYEAKGSLSLWAGEIRPVGVGDILARLEALKKRLAAEGLFASSRKKPLPVLPRTIGLIVGRNTKAKEDVMVNASKRWPAVHFDVREVQVQGAQAVAQIIPALRALDAEPAVDVIVLARGGGSVEDLLPFSDEQLVRAIAATRTPVVSAIGHEGDNPISDFAADVRASTPTDAAKLLVPDRAEEALHLGQMVSRGRAALTARLSRARMDLDALRNRPVLRHPHTMVDARQQDLSSLRSWLRSYIHQAVERENAGLAAKLSQLRALSPQATLDRGFTVLTTDSGHVISRAEQTTRGQALRAILSEGQLTLAVEGIHD